MTTAKAAIANALKAFNTADAAAKVAEVNSKKIAGDPNKKPAEKQAAAKAATDKRNLANTGKTKLTQEQAKEKTTQTAATNAATKLTQSQAEQKTVSAGGTGKVSGPSGGGILLELRMLPRLLHAAHALTPHFFPDAETLAGTRVAPPPQA